MPSLESVRPSVMKELAGWSDDLRDALTRHAPELAPDAMLDRTRERLGAMLSTVEDPGALAPHMRAFTVSGAIYVAFYLALHAEGYDAARAWEVLERATELHFERMSRFEKAAASAGVFSWPMKALSRWLAGRSQRAPLGGWVFEFNEPDGQSDYGVTYTRCAIRELAVAHGAAEIAPYICLADIAGSRAFGWGLTRTGTLAQGAARCDFRFKRGGETRVTVKLPIVA